MEDLFPFPIFYTVSKGELCRSTYEYNTILQQTSNQRNLLTANTSDLDFSVSAQFSYSIQVLLDKIPTDNFPTPFFLHLQFLPGKITTRQLLVTENSPMTLKWTQSERTNR